MTATEAAAYGESSSSRAFTRSGALLSIGEVLNILRPEFADVTISKLRFLEAEGLVDPQRTPAGYRKYTAAHVERLRLVLAAQRDRYLPLRVIREQLDAMERGERVLGVVAPPVVPEPRPSAESPRAESAQAGSPPAGSPPAESRRGASAPFESAPFESPPFESPPFESPPAESSPADSSLIGPPAAVPRVELGEARLTRAQLKERAGLDDAGIADLEQYGLLAPGPNGYYGHEALTVARVAVRLAEYGLEGRHLRPYRGTADREVGLLAQLVLPLSKQHGPNGRAQALETVHELAALCAQLHGALVRQGLRDVLG